MKFLVIQTAFLGDVILATSVLEKLHAKFSDAEIDLLVKKGNESVVEHHPFLNNTLLFNKEKKWGSVFSLIKTIRKRKYSHVINLHRFGSSGFITWQSAAKEKYGFDKNPFSFCYTRKIKHETGNGKHEIERNHELIAALTDKTPVKPKLYPSQVDHEHALGLSKGEYICIAPASVWFTKQFPKEKWIELINMTSGDTSVFLLGASGDASLCKLIREGAVNGRKDAVINLAGKLTLLQTAALMKNAKMNYVNDSAPLHIASAMNAPVTAIFCSTVPAFGFGPLSDRSTVLETAEKLTCRPCGLHGRTSCPEGHFKCATTIRLNDI